MYCLHMLLCSSHSVAFCVGRVSLKQPCAIAAQVAAVLPIDSTVDAHGLLHKLRVSHAGD